MSNNIYPSAEIRWFLKGQDGWDELLYWFTRQGQLNLVQETEDYVRQPEAGPFVKQERSRTDEYLLLPECDTVGVKQRQGRLEVKALVAGPQAFTQDSVAGRVDEWVKWSLKPSEAIAQLLEADLQKSAPWRWVEKKRYTQKYSFDSDSLDAVSPDAWPDAGCNIELTLVGVGQEQEIWITYGFEAFGTSDQVADLLADAVARFITSHGPPPLKLMERDSLSYPAWLMMLR
jgi:hypothetical protein